MAFVFFRDPRRPNEVSATIAGSEWAIMAAIERLEREGNEVTGIVPPPSDRILQRAGCRTQIKANRCR
jgi:hypothetical protein